MADSYSIIDDQVVPYYGGRASTCTDSWRDATELELSQQQQIKELEDEMQELFNKIDELEEYIRILESGEN